MFKHTILLSSIIALTACTSLNQRLQCDPEKNYTNSNPEAIKEYLSLKKDKKIVSIYQETTPLKPCYADSCLYFERQTYDFIEMKFNDKKRNGIYSIYITDDLTRKDCFEHDPISTPLKNKCFYSVKNENNEIKSRYIKKTTYNDNGNGISISLYDQKTNQYILTSNVTSYSNGALGAISGGFCKTKKNNDSNISLFDI